jgi:hypothetical protein
LYKEILRRKKMICGEVFSFGNGKEWEKLKIVFAYEKEIHFFFNLKNIFLIENKNCVIENM